MNSTLPQSVIDEALKEDFQAAKSEYLAEFRDDISSFVTRDLVERLVVPERLELLPEDGRKYHAFCDVSGGRGDDAALAIAHYESNKIVLDLVHRWRPPFSPHAIVGEMATQLRRFNIRKVVGDNYGAEFVAQSFASNDVKYEKSLKPKNVLYQELLPALCSGEVELLDDKFLIDQLSSLERRTRSGGRDVIDHARGGHDDIANVVAGVVVTAKSKRVTVGSLW